MINRFDTTLVDFSERAWQRGDVSFVFDSTAADKSEQFFIMDNKAKCFQRIKKEVDII
jgi:hypothetical protein